jgi:hypothetical protein
VTSILQRRHSGHQVYGGLGGGARNGGGADVVDPAAEPGSEQDLELSAHALQAS